MCNKLKIQVLGKMDESPNNYIVAPQILNPLEIG